MDFLTDFVYRLVMRLPAMFGVVSETDGISMIKNSGTDADVAAAMSVTPDPLFLKGLIIMLLIGCIILVCKKLTRIDIAYAREL